jgi:hypothetical protein
MRASEPARCADADGVEELKQADGALGVLKTGESSLYVRGFGNLILMSVARSKLFVPWKRFWCRFGDAIHVGEHGFLTDPDEEFTRFFNPHLATLDQLLSERCLILCGDPGIGKTTELQQAKSAIQLNLREGDQVIWLEFRDIPSESVFFRGTFDSAVWRAWRSSAGRLVLVVDGVDEGLVKIPDFVSYLAGQFRAEPVERLQVLLACRSAEWPVAAGSELTALWGAKQKLPVFELCPLRQRDAELAAKVRGLDSQTFIQAVYQNQVVGMAALPTTLFFLLEDFHESGRFSATHEELFKRGCSRLLREHDPRKLESLRALRKTARLVTPQEANLAASRLAALLLLCGRSAIEVGPIGKANADDDLHPSEASDALGIYASPSVTEDLLLETIGTGLFTSRGPNRFGFAHQTFAECLAAQFLSPLPLVQVRSLLCGRDAGQEHVIPQLAETAAWLAGMREDFFDYLCQIEPETLLRSDVARVQSQRKIELVAAILDRAKRAELFDERHNRRFLGSLNSPGIAAQLTAFITDKALNVVARRMALEIARECHLPELTDALFRVVRDTADNQHIREQAAYTLSDSLPDVRLAELIPLAKGELDPDPHDEIRGYALRRLVPKVWTVAQALLLLPAPRNRNFFGSYDLFLKHDLPRHLAESNLPSVLGRLICWTRCFDTLSPFKELAEAAFVEALQRLGTKRIRRLAVRVWLAKARHHHPLPHGKDSKIIELLEEREGLRRAFVEAILNDPETSEEDVWHLQGPFVHLLLSVDFPWLLDRIVAVAKDRGAAWAQAIAMLSHPETTAAHWDCFLGRLEAVPELKVKFSWLRAWGLDEPEARKAKAQWLKEERRKRRLCKEELRPNVEGLLERQLQLIAAGKTHVWIYLCGALSMNEGDAHLMVPLKHDLSEFPGWKRATAERQQQIVTASRQFLLEHSDGYAESGSRTNYSDPGYIAIWLLRDTLPQDPEVRAAIAANWIGALVGYFNNSSEHYQVSAVLAYQLNPEATLQHFVRQMKEDDHRHGQLLCLHGFSRAWDARFTAAALEFAESGTPKHGSIESILNFVAKFAPEAAAACARQFLSPTAIADSSLRERTLCVLTASLGRMAAQTWDFVWPILDADNALAESILLRVADRIGYEAEKNLLPLLSEQQLADLYRKVQNLFPPSSDPKWGGGCGVVTPRMAVMDLRRNLITALEARGTEEACRELLRLADTLPEESVWLRWSYHRARESKRRKSWEPPSPQIVLGLATRCEARFVHDADDLLEVVCESLERLQVQLTQNTLPRAEDLWHWELSDPKRQGFRPKDEAALSDYIACWLRDDLRQRGIVIGRELQPRRGQRTDIYVTAAQQATAFLPPNGVTVVIEVKGCWHPKVREAATSQLVGDYLRLNGLRHGIYLVGWFVCPSWVTPQNELHSQTLEDARREVAGLVVSFDGRANPERVRAFVLDCRYPESSTRH